MIHLTHALRALCVAIFMCSPVMVWADGYQQINLVANKQIYAPQIIDTHMVNAWGLAIRPAGEGGHFWINNTDDGTVSLYVGDTQEKALYQDDIKIVAIAKPEKSKLKNSAPTGQVFNQNEHEFTITQERLTGPSKFIFCTEEGTISAWTEKKNEDGSFARPRSSLIVVDNSKKGAVYKGLAISTKPNDNRLYAADFGRKRIDVFNNSFAPVILGATAFELPTNTIPKGYAPFNIQELGGTLFVAYAKTTKEVGEEQQGAGLGYVAEFDFDGKFKRMLEGGKLLNAPWGLARAPDNFGKLSNTILAGNFGDGHIIAFDAETGKQLDALRTPAGTPVAIDGLWGILFGNGVHLGASNHLYFAAGPNGEKDGVFGKLVPAQ
jgi:uncharacterized protein (TIGR03118 family)